MAAIERARQEGAVLLVAKLDRLARNVAFFATLLEGRGRFQAVDLPIADKFTLHIMAAMAQKEALAISTRTRAALAAKKTYGTQLGTPTDSTQATRGKSWAATTQNALTNLNNRQAAHLAALLQATGAPLRAIAEQLNQSGYRMRHGKAFHPMGAQHLLARAVQPAVYE